MGEAGVSTAANGGDGAAAATATASSSLRRSKRDSVAKVESAKMAGNGQDDGANTALTARRSQRSVKSAYATPPKETPAPATRDTTGKKTVKAAVWESTESETPVRRGRPPRAATATADFSTPMASPVHSPKRADAPSDVDALMSTPTRNRRPSRRQLEVDAPLDRAHMLMGQFTANDATALCEAVWYQIKENSYKADVLLRDQSPACIDWHRVAERLARSHESKLTPRACQRLWKFLAYAQETPEENDKLVADSDPEEYELTADKINVRVKATAETKGAEEPETAKETSSGEEPATSAPVSEESSDAQKGPTATASSAPTGESSNKTLPPDTTPEQPAAAPITPADDPSPVARETRRTAGVQLYPQYNQPSGIPDEWQKPFDPKNSMPLVFVAEKFLKRKVVQPKASSANGDRPNTSLEVDPSILAAAAMSVTLTGERLQPKPKKKRAAEPGDDQKPKKPRKKKEPTVVNGAGAKPPLTPAASAPVSTLAAAMTKSPLPLRPGYVPSLTAPPSPTPARPAVDFFRQLYRENPNVLRGLEQSTAGTSATSATLPSSTAHLDAAQLATFFANAPLQVRTACEQMANDDLRRFEREHLRRRLWEKARASLHNSPAPSPASTPAPSLPTPTASVPTAPPTPAPTTAVVAAVPTAPTSSSSVAPTSQISVPTPSTQVP